MTAIASTGGPEPCLTGELLEPVADEPRSPNLRMPAARSAIELSCWR